MTKLLRDILSEVDRTGHEVLHHISPHDIDSFHPLSHFGTYKAAKQIGSQLHRSEVSDKSSYNASHRDRYHYKARLINKGTTHHMSGDAGSHTPSDLIHSLHHEGVFNRSEVNHHFNNLQKIHRETGGSDDSPHHKALEYAANAIRSKGIHTLSYKNEYEHAGQKSYITTHPDQVHVLSKTKVAVRSNQVRDKSVKPVIKL